VQPQHLRSAKPNSHGSTLAKLPCTTKLPCTHAGVARSRSRYGASSACLVAYAVSAQGKACASRPRMGASTVSASL